MTEHDQESILNGCGHIVIANSGDIHDKHCQIATGHGLPIVVAGSSTAAFRRLIENNSWIGAGNIFRKGAGVMICLLGTYFIIKPFIGI
jgi:hypothetical protein